MSKYIVVKDYTKKVRRFNLTGRTLEFKIKTPSFKSDPVSWVQDAINQVIAEGTRGLGPNDQVSFSFGSNDMARTPGWISFRPVKNVTYEDVWRVISSVYQSNSKGLNTSTFCLSVTSVKMPAGRGNKRGRDYNTFQEESLARRGVITITNNDNKCLPRALVVAKAYVDKDPEFNQVRRDIGKLQTQRAIQLIEDAAVSIPDAGCGIVELEQFQSHLAGYRIVVYQYGSKGRGLLFKGIADGPSLNLLYYEGHYNVITSLTSSFCCGYFCEECHVPYNTKGKHRCQASCGACLQTPACPQGIKVACFDCKRSFRGQTCYDNHRNAGSLGKGTVCQQIKRCEECLKTIKSDRKHVCGEVYCKICRKHVPGDHLCYMQRDTSKPKTNDELFIFYDLETRQEKEQNGDLLHEPNLCVFKQCCDTCFDSSNSITCKKCGVRLQVLKCADPITPFVHHILTIRKKFKKVMVIAHNGQAFDHNFILNYLLIESAITPELIMRGTKIISMTVGNVKFLDSLNYFPMPLAKLPTVFGLDSNNFKKGYFPHLFNTISNADYVGPLPAIEYYSPDSMKIEERQKFLDWHKQHENDKFDLRKELIEYCISDVEILTEACRKFRQQMLQTGNVCPFTEACTIASCCNKPRSMGIIPKGGYRYRDNQSSIAIQWLVWEEKQQNIKIKHAARGKESTVQGVKVDGYCAETKQIYQFYGCYYHGCTTCFRYNRDAPMHDDSSQTLNTRYESTMAQAERLRNMGYVLIEMWECRFRKQLQENPCLKQYTESHRMLAMVPLNPRDAFYGGRTGNTHEYYKCKDDEQIKYVDVCSLYPWVCKYGKFPIGHPEVVVGEDCSKLNMETVEGVIKCKILPPENLYHPVLPMKANGKLMFVLCRTCGETMNLEECNHSREERALLGTWIVDEVRAATERGYQIVEIYEIWSYKVTRFDKKTKTKGLFTEMMNKFIKVKQEASGWPQHCKTQEEKENYITEFFDREDVELESTAIVENPGLRSLAKLMLNSFWGKLGQRQNQPKTAIVRSSDEFFAMLSNSSLVINSALPVNEKTLIVNYELRDEACDPLTSVNVVIAAYVTTQARLKLYSYLEQLKDRALYYDTDSVIYISKPSQNDIATGQCIGDMTNELIGYGPNSYITEFVSGGPKNYAFKVFSTSSQTEEIVCKVKGISLNYDASQVINFDTIRSMVLSNDTEPVYIISNNIERTKHHEVISRTQTKMYRPNSRKRKFLQDHSSYPYGFKRPKS
ncbi:hypothetical protein NQ315_011388 [Exocentrus adspersus]|uniref:DNA-directed DNA polymerase n=1 Tax=Exocentrus adspersus TaxID=1586481 RepID=A0AAV8VJC4_9CUCU|nr:hypothetical protein NQ315_011388 [Exocentrus adspersus]